MEADGYKFYGTDGREADIFALMKDLGMTAIRLRVWVDPVSYGYGPWCNKADVVSKARRAYAQGLDLMIDFHYSDFFADPGRQIPPKQWEGVAKHTKDVLQALKNEGITPRWVQVGNETNHWYNNATDGNEGYDSVKEVFPSATVIIHVAGPEIADWFFTNYKAAGGKFDMIGLSHYPTDIRSNAAAAGYVKAAAEKFDVPVMIVETGFEVSQTELGSEIMKDLFERLGQIQGCSGIFYWEPETDGRWKPGFYSTLGWPAYTKGAFSPSGRPTKILDAFIHK